MKENSVWIRLVIGLIAGLFLANSLPADTISWVGQTGDWFTAENWDLERVPAAGDEVQVNQTGAEISLTANSPFLGKLDIVKGSLVMSNWDTLLAATNVTIANGGILTCEGPFLDEAMSNRVNLLCTNLLIESGGAIDVLGKGYSGGINADGKTYQNGYGPGAGNGGGAYGGTAGRWNNHSGYETNNYGSAEAPLDPGSGGKGPSWTDYKGSHGGGAIRIVADEVVVNGLINANASKWEAEPWASGGSGGAVFITCRTISGEGGLISADGYMCAGSGGAGSGGRIAIIYDTDAQNAIDQPSFRCSAAGGYSKNIVTNCGEIGTLYFPDSRLFSPTNLFTGQWMAPTPSETIVIDDWTVSNVWLRITGLKVSVNNTLTIAGTNSAQFKLELINSNSESAITCGSLLIKGATLSLGAPDWPFYYPNENYWDERNQIEKGPTLTVTDNLMLTNINKTGSRLVVYAGLEHEAAPADYGALVEVGGDIITYSNCWIHPVAHPTNGTVPLFKMDNLKVERYGGFNASEYGFASGRVAGNGTNIWNKPHGPGISTNNRVNYVEANAGSSYGGLGTPGYYGYPGPTYGSADEPILPGSGARAGWMAHSEPGPWGGGSVQIRAEDTVSLAGSILANGGTGMRNYGPASSGGGIYIRCKTFIGTADGMITADGGYATPNGTVDGGGGGGGRIAIWRMNDFSDEQLTVTADGGFGGNYTTNITGVEGVFATGEPGTIVWGQIPLPGTILRFR